MQCPYCYATVPEGSKFCNSCGGAIETAPTPCPVQEQPPVAEEVTTPVAEPVWASTEQAVPETIYTPPKSRRKPFVALICVIAAVALLLVAGLLTNWFGLVAPVDQVVTATARTLRAKSYTITGTVYQKYPEYNWNSDTRQREFLGMKTVESEVFLQIIFDEKEEDIIIYGTAEDENGVEEILVYDGYCVSFYPDGRCDYYDCSDSIQAFYDSKEDAKNALKELRKAKPDYEDALDDLFGRGTYDELEDVVEFDEVKGCLRAVHKQINKRRWLKKNFDYSTKLSGGTKIHSFHLESLDFLEDLLPLIEPAFARRTDYRETEDALEDVLDTELDVEIRFGVKGGKMTLLEIDSISKSGEYDQVISYSFEFSKIGRTKIDTSELEELLDEAIAYEQTEDYTYGSTWNGSF